MASRRRSVPAHRHWPYIPAFQSDLHVALRRQIIDFIRLRFLNQPDQIGRVGEVAVMQEKSCAFRMRVFI